MVHCPTNGRETVLSCLLIDGLPDRSATDGQEPLPGVDRNTAKVTEVDDEVLGRRSTGAGVASALDGDLKVVCDRVLDLQGSQTS